MSLHLCLEADIQYRFALDPVYISHMYEQVSSDHWSAGRSQMLGIKGRVEQFRADIHQRLQEEVFYNKNLPIENRKKTRKHKGFYASDLMVNGIQIRGIRADFTETDIGLPIKDRADRPPKVSELPKDQRAWFNHFDFIDVDRRPHDRDPEVEVVQLMDCPQAFLSQRHKARLVSTEQPKDKKTKVDVDAPREMEATKFGHEESHICYLGAAKGVGPAQMQITRARIAELEEQLRATDDTSTVSRASIGCYPADPMQSTVTDIQGRLRTLRRHLEDLATKEHRCIDDVTLQPLETDTAGNKSADENFQLTLHVHCPRVYYNNTSRNLIFKYYFSNRDRKQEEWAVSYASLRSILENAEKRAQRQKTGLNADDLPAQTSDDKENMAQIMLRELERALIDKNVVQQFQTSTDNDEDDIDRKGLGIPTDCSIEPNLAILVMKPQIALRSELDETSVVLLAVEEVSFRQFRVLDDMGKDKISSRVLNR